MGIPQAIDKMTAQEFAAWELDEPKRHEFFRAGRFSGCVAWAGRWKNARWLVRTVRVLRFIAAMPIAATGYTGAS